MPQEKMRPAFTFDKERIEQLRAVVPEAFADGKINWDILHEALGDYLESETPEAEHFGLFWPGKREARRLASIPSTGTLVPCIGEGAGEDKTHNTFIEGDNLEVLKLLQKSYAGQVNMIYIDPPYNTGKDFIYPDNFSQPLENYLSLTGQKSAEGITLTTNPESSGRFHSSWLSMIYPRLRLARQLLDENGIIFISTDDNEIHNLRQVMNEVFGEENFQSVIVVQSNKRGQTYKQIAKTHEYILIYTNNPSSELRELEKGESSLPFKDSIGEFDLWELRNRNPKFGRFNRPNLFFPIYVAPSINDESGYAKVSLVRDDNYQIEVFPLNSEGRESCWRWGKVKIESSDLTGNIPVIVARQKRDGKWNIYEKSRKSTTKVKSIWSETEVISEQGTVELGELELGGAFDHPKPVALIKKCLQIAMDKHGIVLDFFAGAATTAHALLLQNAEDGGTRHFILVQFPEPIGADYSAISQDFRTVADIGKERIRRAIAKMRKGKAEGDLGFKVYKLDRSNFKAWQDYHGEDMKQLEMLFDRVETPLVEGWTPESLLTEVMLIQGFPLDSTVTQQHEFKKNNVQLIESDASAHRLFVCLDKKIHEETEKALKVSPGDIFVCLDSAMTDQAKMRLSNNCTLATI
jgi:adenine-specific DNA-methyltransferase